MSFRFNRITHLEHVFARKGWRYHIHWKTWLRRIGLLLIGCGVIALLGFVAERHYTDLETVIRHVGPWAPLCYIGLFVALTPLFVPNSGFGLVAGALFGLWHGLLWLVIAGVVAESVIFWITRLFFRDRVERLLSNHPRLLAVQGAVLAEPVRMMLLLRLSPVPFTPLCYMLSVTPVRFRDYLLAFVGFVPGNFVTVYAGFMAGHVAKVAHGKSHLDWGEYVVALVGLIACVVLVIRISKAAHRAVDKAQAAQA